MDTKYLRGKKRIIFFTIIFSLSFLIQGVLLVSHYGINWDEPIHYIRGQAFLRFFLTGKKDYNDLPKLRSHYYNNSLVQLPKGTVFEDDSYFRKSIYQYDREPYKFSFEYFAAGEEGEPGHPPLNDILASFFNYVLYQKLGVVNDIESYHIFVILVSSLLVGLVFFITSEQYGIFAGSVAALSLSFYPLFFGESHFNIKDPVSTAFISFTLYALYKGIIKKSLKWIFASSIFAGLALGTKFNIFFAVFIVFPWIVIYFLRSFRSFTRTDIYKLLIGVFFLIITPFSILYASWPYLWENPINHLLAVFAYYKEVGYTHFYQPNQYLFAGFNTYPIQAVIYTTPLIILFLSCIGLLYTIKKGLSEKYNMSLFVLFWFLVPIFRVSLPNAGIYGGTRQVMEYIPAMAILSGIGAGCIAKLLHGYIATLIKKIHKKQLSNAAMKQLVTVTNIIILLSFIPITLKLISIHPNENVYFNSLISGLKGAKEKNFPDWGLTLGNTYKQGVSWLNANAEQGAKLALIRGLLSNVPSTQLREDILFDNRYYSGLEQKGEYLMELTDYQWSTMVSKEKRSYIETLRPVYEVKVDEIPILTIWKNDFEHRK